MKMRLFNSFVLSLCVVLNVFCADEVLDDFSDNQIDPNLWAIEAGNVGGGSGFGNVYEEGEQFVIYSEDSTAQGGGVALAVFKESILDRRLYFSFHLTLSDSDLSGGYSPDFRISMLEKNTIERDLNEGQAMGEKAFLCELRHDQQTELNEFNDAYYIYCDSKNRKVGLYEQSNGALINEADYSHFLSKDAYLYFQAYEDTQTGFNTQTFRLKRVWIEMNKKFISTVTVPDVNNNGYPEIAALYTNIETNESWVVVKDSNTNQPLIEEVVFDSSWEAHDLSTVPDITNDGIAEMNILATHKENNEVVSRIVDPSGKNLVNTIVFNPKK